MQKKRVFTAINLPDNIKEELLKYQENWPELPAKWTKEENIHITLNFLGYVSDEKLLNILDSVKKTAETHSCFEIKINKICYGPKGKMPPRMIWAIGEKSKELSLLKNELDKTLNDSENRDYSPHITLARIKAWDWKNIDPEDRPEIEEDANLIFEAKSIEVMESILKKQGPNYTILESYNLV